MLLLYNSKLLPPKLPSLYFPSTSIYSSLTLAQSYSSLVHGSHEEAEGTSFCVSVLFTVRDQTAETDRCSILEEDPSVGTNLGSAEPPSAGGAEELLTYDFYSTSCPSAERIIRTTVRELHEKNSSVGPALLRLAFHDCFVMGCDASILLDSDSEAGISSEKESVPNFSISGFEQVDAIKSRLELECPAVVSCAEIVALAARESVSMAGGQFYPVFTGRMDRKMAFRDNATIDLPSPNAKLFDALDSFAAKGFSARETVALLGGGHSTGRIHCNFIHNRLFNFTGTGKPDPTINADFLEVLRSECSHPASPTSAASFENRAMQMDYEGAGNGFGDVYYRSLLQGRGLLVVDQQLTQGPETKALVETYASDRFRFRRDFGLAMFKLTHLQVPREAESEVRLDCRRVNNVV